MVTAAQFRLLALALEGTRDAPHFERTAFMVARTYATLAADGATANLKLLPDEQLLKCTTAGDAFAPVAGGWGARGWTTVILAKISRRDLDAALRLAWTHALPRPRKPR